VDSVLSDFSFEICEKNADTQKRNQSTSKKKKGSEHQVGKEKKVRSADKPYTGSQ